MRPASSPENSELVFPSLGLVCLSVLARRRSALRIRLRWIIECSIYSDSLALVVRREMALCPTGLQVRSTILPSSSPSLSSLHSSFSCRVAPSTHLYIASPSTVGFYKAIFLVEGAGESRRSAAGSPLELTLTLSSPSLSSLSSSSCSLLDPPPDSNFPTDTSASGSSSFSSKLQPSSSNGSSHQPRPPAPPASSSSSFSSAPAPAQQPSYSPTTQDSHQPNRSSSSTSATVSKSRSPPPPRHDSHDLSSSSNSNKRARHSLPNPTTNTTNTLLSFQTYQPPLTYSSSSSSTSTAEPRPAPPPASSSSRPSQAAPVPAPPPPHHNSIAFLLHPWSPANDEFGPGRIRGAKVEPLPVGVPVGLGVEAVGKKDAAGVLFKVPAVPLGRGGKQQQGVASSSSSGSNPNTTASPTTNTPLASSSTSSHPPHHHHHPTAQALNGTASVSPNPNSIPSTSPFDASFNDRPSSSDLQDLKRTCLAPLSFLFPWIPSRISSPSGQVEAEGEGEGEKVAGAVDLAVASWGAR